MAGFNYVIVSTNQVQNILKENDLALQSDIKHKTDVIFKKAFEEMRRGESREGDNDDKK